MYDDSPVRIETERLVLAMPAPDAAPVLARFYRENDWYFTPWDPPRPPSFTTEAFWVQRLAANRRAYEDDRELRLYGFEKDAPGRVVNVVSFTNVVRGPLQACNLGYAQAKVACGRGLMNEALVAAIRHAFTRMELHRIEASYVPTNEASAKVLRRLGFSVEGYSRDYLFVGGKWRDHVRCALVNPDPEAWRQP